MRARPGTLRRAAAWTLLTVGLAGLALAGCAKKRIVAIDNLPPETTVFVSGDLDTVNHIVEIFWFGSDPDGEVVAFELRLRNPASPADSQWVRTTRTDSVFTVFTPSGFTMPTFEVRAIDDAGTRDPSPARTDFRFKNDAPTVSFVNRLRTNDTTYASVTLEWTAADNDGDANALTFQVGLDTLPGALRLVSGSTVTVDTSDFKIAGVYPATRPRQAFIRAIDDGGRASRWDSVRWVVRAPSTGGQHPRLLLIDDVPSTNPAAGTTDSLWLNTANRNLPAGSFSVLRLEHTQPFRSTKDVLQTFRLFDAVIWYRGTQDFASSLMRDRQDALAAYLDGGGKLLIESKHLIEGEKATGSLREEWVTRYLGSRGLIRAQVAGFADSTVAWSITAGFVDTVDSQPVTRNIILRSTMFADSLRNGANSNGLRGFDVRDTGFVALWARDSSLSPRVARDIPVAVSVPVPESPPGPGRAVIFTLPIRGANLYFTAPRFLAKVFQQLGLTTP